MLPTGEEAFCDAMEQAVPGCRPAVAALLALGKKATQAQAVVMGQHPGPEEGKLTVHIRDQVRAISAKTKDSILQSLERNGIAAPSRCRSGECGDCRTRLLSGEVFAPKAMEHRRQADHTYGYVHACCTFPPTDLEIDVPPAESC